MKQSNTYHEKMAVPKESLPYVDVSECPIGAHGKGDSSLTSEEHSAYERILNYYYGGHCDGSICLGAKSGSMSWKKYFPPVVYSIALTAVTFLHQDVLAETGMPYFLMAVYNTITTAIALLCIIYGSRSPKGTPAVDDIEGSHQTAEVRNESRHWKPFAFILLYLFAEEGFWFSLNSMPLARQRLTYLAYPVFVAFFTWEWVFSGRKERILKAVGAEDVQRLQMAAGGLLVICWSSEASFEWWTCAVAVALGAFKNVITRDILTSDPHIASELVMLGSSALSFKALMSCYDSNEYPKVWARMIEVSWGTFAKVLIVGVCYGTSQMVAVETLRRWEPIRGSWAVMAPAAFGVIGSFALGHR